MINPGIFAVIASDSIDSDRKRAEKAESDLSLDNLTLSAIKEVDWNNSPRQRVINNIARVMSSPFFEAFARGDFAFLGDLIQKHGIKHHEIASANEDFKWLKERDEFNKKSWLEIYMDFFKTISGYNLFFGKKNLSK